MTNRLNELRDEEDSGLKIEMVTVQIVPDEQDVIQVFFKHADEIKLKIASIGNDISTLERKYSTNIADIKVATQSKEEKEYLEETRKNISQNIQLVKTELDKMNKRMMKIKEEDGEGCAEYRLRSAHYNRLQASFQDTVKEFARVQNEYKNKQEETLKRHIRIVNSDATDEEVERMLSDPGIELDQLFSQAIIGSSALHTRDAIYSRVKETRDDLLKLEDSMNELVELFQDMHSLVLAQQGLIDSIELSVMKASDYVEKGITNTKKAKKHQKKSRLLLFLVICAAIGLILLIAGILVVVLVVLTPTVFVRL